jgi:hypothetical protein
MEHVYHFDIFSAIFALKEEMLDINPHFIRFTTYFILVLYSIKALFVHTFIFLGLLENNVF